MLALLRFACLSDWKPLVAAVGAFALISASGCTLCPPGYIDDYATIGGKWQRTDPAEGRVGSPFSDGATNLGANSVTSSVRDGEVIYDDGIIIAGAGVDSYEGAGVDSYEGAGVDSYDGAGVDSYDGDFGAEPYYDDSIELVPQYETLGEDW